MKICCYGNKILQINQNLHILRLGAITHYFSGLAKAQIIYNPHTPIRTQKRTRPYVNEESCR
jgi:hypothetical protein